MLNAPSQKRQTRLSPRVKSEYLHPASGKPLLYIPRIPISNTSRISLHIPILITLSPLIKRQNIRATSRSTHNAILSRDFPLFPAGEIGFFSGHETAWVENVEEDEGEEHEGGVEDVLVGFVAWDAAFDAFGVFEEPDY